MENSEKIEIFKNKLKNIKSKIKKDYNFFEVLNANLDMFNKQELKAIIECLIVDNVKEKKLNLAIDLIVETYFLDIVFKK